MESGRAIILFLLVGVVCGLMDMGLAIFLWFY